MTLVWSSYVNRPSDSEHVVPFPMQITGFYVFFTFLSFPVIFLALSFSPSVLLPLLSLFLPLSVCLCVCVSMQFPVIFFWFCSCFFQFISFSCMFLSFSLLSLLYLLSASVSLQTLTKGSHTYICMVRPRVQYLDALGTF